MHYLVIDTCTERGLVAYGSQDTVLFERELPFGLNQSKHLLPIVREALMPHGLIPNLTAIGVAIGPGSYTGIRIGVSVAQALAYSWNIPLIGLPSLEGFEPSCSAHFAAVVDARIAGIYFQKGIKNEHGVVYEGDPQVCPLDQIEKCLFGIEHLVTPCMKSLQTKLSQLFPHVSWAWEERGPSALRLLKNAMFRHEQGESIEPPRHLNLLYLRETEAEREKVRQG